MLAMIASQRDLHVPALREPPVAIYCFIDHHLQRAMGSIYVTNRYGKEAPYYVLTSGRIERRGNFLYDRPIRAALYWLLGKSQLIRTFNLDWPVQSMGVPLTAAIISEAARELQRKVGAAEFVFVIYPGSRFGNRIGGLVGASNVRVLDLSTLFDPTEPIYHLVGDGHPSALANAELASAIARDLSGR